jgi:deoxyribodipyrimidine photo-lyase
MKKNIGLHWFRKDLRLEDNPSLSELARKVDELVCVYILDDKTVFEDINSSSKKELFGEHRTNFVYQALVDLDASLKELGQDLIILKSSDLNALVGAIDSLSVTHVSAEWHCGFNEQNQWKELISLRPQLDYVQNNGATLFQESQFPFSIENMPSTFSPFRKKVEKYCHIDALDDPIKRIPPPNMQSRLLNKYDVKSLIIKKNQCSALSGGETKALAQLKYYLWDTDLIATYKVTRNGLDGWEFSSKLSAWLAQGCISPKRIYHEITRYEAQRTKNDSTYWLFFELLWREFFHWHHFVHRAALFSRNGVQEFKRISKHDTNIVLSWQQGNTGYPIVDACMRQLLATGFMSNRGRQLVASCFVHELGQDWRYGARYFEYQLIDFDVASNWGNWQYLAGVGADPRGHRQFNLAKQTEIYDPQQKFISDWLA